MRRIVMILSALVAVCPLAAVGAEGERSGRADTPAAREYQSMTAAYQEAREEFEKAVEHARTDAARQNALAAYRKQLSELAPRYLAFARKYPGDRRAADALGMAVVVAPDSPVAGKAVDAFLEDHPRSEVLGHVCWALSARGTPGAEKLLRSIFARSRSRKIQAEAALNLGRLLRERAERPGVRRAEATALTKEAEETFARIVDRYGEVTKMAEAAEHELFEMRELVVGKRAPEIVGIDAEGTKFKLSDYRGKVVVLDFWAGWCPPCLEMAPHGRALMKRMRGKPFALLGIDRDASRAALKKAQERYEITWRSWFDGEDGPIARTWNVRGLPVVYVLDAQGIIRYKHVHGRELDEAVETLLKEMKGGRR